MNLLFFAQIRNIFEVVTLDLCYFKLIEECYLCKAVPVACIQPSFPEPRAQGTQAASPAQWCGPERFSDFPPCISVTWSSHTRWALKDRNCSTHSTMNAGTELFMWDSYQDQTDRLGDFTDNTECFYKLLMKTSVVQLKAGSEDVVLVCFRCC